MSSAPRETFLTPYLQLARVGRYPVGTLKVFWPAAWAAIMAAYRVNLNPTDLAKNVAGIAIASSLVHTTICTLNDICDRNIDANIERCKKRPLPSGRVSLKAAVIFLLAQTAGCLALLKGMVRDDVVPLGLIGLFPLHGLYPLMKRITYWPQVWLGLSGAAGAAVCWKQIVGSVDPWVIVPSSVAMVFWTIHFDTVYASQDRKDDKENGVGSTAVLFGDYIREICALFAFGFVALEAFAGYKNGQGPLFYLLAIGSAAIHLTWQLTTVDFDRKGDGMRMFVANGNMGYYMFAGMLADWATQYYNVALPIVA